MNEPTLRRLLGLLEELDVALTRPDLRGGRRPLRAASRIVLALLDDERRK